MRQAEETDGIVGVGYETPEELDAWLEELTKEIEKSNPPFWFDSLCREGAEWTNLSLTLPLEEEKTGYCWWGILSVPDTGIWFKG